MTKVREKGYKDTDIISMSEEYFQLADKMVDAAENCSQRYATQINQIEKALIVIMILIVALLIKESVEQVVLSKKNRELRKKAYLDLHTGLPNKSRCKQLHLEYAYGYAVSDAYSECCSMKILLEQADRNMYKCKAEMKEHRKNSHGEI